MFNISVTAHVCCWVSGYISAVSLWSSRYNTARLLLCGSDTSFTLYKQHCDLFLWQPLFVQPVRSPVCFKQPITRLQPLWHGTHLLGNRRPLRCHVCWEIKPKHGGVIKHWGLFWACFWRAVALKWVLPISSIVGHFSEFWNGTSCPNGPFQCGITQFRFYY